MAPLYTGGIFKSGGNQYNGGIIQSNFKLVNSLVSGCGYWWHVSLFDCPITPTSVNSKILIICSLGSVSGNNNSQGFQIRRNGSEVTPLMATGNASRPRLSFRGARNWAGDSNHTWGCGITLLDDPQTTSSVTYRLYARAESNGELYINRTQNNSNGGDVYQGNTTSSMTVFEISDT